MTATIHDLVAAYGMPAVEAWIGGDLALGEGDGVPPLTPTERRLLLGSWSFWARPGQRWVPGAERARVTLLSGGRGAGKTLVGSHAIHEAALDPERWGGEALIVGPEPMHVRNKCLGGPTGVLTLAKAFGSRYLTPRHNQQNRTLVFPAPRGGGSGLRVTYASSADPKSVRGDGVGFLWGDEFGFWYFSVRDDNGNNAWEASDGAMRGGRDPKVLLTTTPSEAPDVDALFEAAEAPTCPRCRVRLPPLEGQRISPLFAATSTQVVRSCPACRTRALADGNLSLREAEEAGRVVAEVRVVVLPTLDNRSLPASQREVAARKLATGRARHLREWGGQRAASQGALVRRDDLRVLPVALPLAIREAHGPAAGRCDWEQQALTALGVTMVGVFVDPAVTSAEGSCDTGVAVVGARLSATVAGEFECILLEDCSVTPEQVDGAPSATWAPVAADAAVRWGAAWAAVETNQGGDEVLDALRRAVATVPKTWAYSAAAAFMGHDAAETFLVEALLADRGGSRAVAVHETKRRVAAVALLSDPGRVLGHRRVASKRARWGWLGDVAAEGRIVLATLTHLGGEEHVARIRRQLCAWVPDPRKPASATSEPRDSADAFVAACQLLLGVTEARGEVVDEAASGPGSMSSQVAALGRGRSGE